MQFDHRQHPKRRRGVVALDLGTSLAAAAAAPATPTRPAGSSSARPIVLDTPESPAGPPPRAGPLPPPMRPTVLFPRSTAAASAAASAVSAASAAAAAPAAKGSGSASPSEDVVMAADGEEGSAMEEGAERAAGSGGHEVEEEPVAAAAAAPQGTQGDREDAECDISALRIHRIHREQQQRQQQQRQWRPLPASLTNWSRLGRGAADCAPAAAAEGDERAAAAAAAAMTRSGHSTESAGEVTEIDDEEEAGRGSGARRKRSPQRLTLELDDDEDDDGGVAGEEELQVLEELRDRGSQGSNDSTSPPPSSSSSTSGHDYSDDSRERPHGRRHRPGHDAPAGGYVDDRHWGASGQAEPRRSEEVWGTGGRGGFVRASELPRWEAPAAAPMPRRGPAVPMLTRNHTVPRQGLRSSEQLRSLMGIPDLPDAPEEEGLTQEEKDLRLAMRLQREEERALEEQRMTNQRRRQQLERAYAYGSMREFMRQLYMPPGPRVAPAFQSHAPRMSRSRSAADLHRRLEHTSRDFDEDDYEMLLQLDEGVKSHKGALKSDIESLPLRVVAEGETPGQCCICLDEIEVGASVRTLPCMHVFHQDCIDKWLSMNRTCPIDKREINGGNGP
eukprot:m51a1_g3563 putative ring u-box superfamily isoform 2 (616) ;mRNA; f:1059086-1062206